MSKKSWLKTLFILAAWYVAWTTVSSLFSTKKGRELQKDLKKAYEEKADPTGILLDNFVELHKNMFENIKKKATSDDAKKFFKDKKTQVFKLLDKYKAEWEKMLDELKVKWKDYTSNAWEKLETFFKEKKEDLVDYLEWLKLDKDDIQDYKDKLNSIYEDLKAKIKK